MSDELVSAREKKRQTEERAKQFYDKITKQEAEVADLRRELASSQNRLADLQRQKSEMDKRMSELQNNLDAMNRAMNSLQRNIENHRQSIAADHIEMERFNAEVQRLDHVIADLMRRR
ncbi:MAG: hypothetical protein ACLQEQ_03515 [Nitrososphaerales archaeon]